MKSRVRRLSPKAGLGSHSEPMVKRERKNGCVSFGDACAGLGLEAEVELTISLVGIAV